MQNKIEKVRYVLIISISFTISIFFCNSLRFKRYDILFYFLFMVIIFYYFIKKNDIVKSSSNQELVIIIICLISIFPYHNDAIISQNNTNGYLGLIKNDKLGPRNKKIDFSTLIYASNHMRDNKIFNHVNTQLTKVGLKKLDNHSKNHCSYLVSKWQKYIQQKKKKIRC